MSNIQDVAQRWLNRHAVSHRPSPRGVTMFGPASDLVVGALWFAALAALVGVAVCWHRLNGHGLKMILARLGTQVGASMLVVLAVASLLNQQNGWYGSWSDLGRDLSGASPSVQRTAVKGQAQVEQEYDPRGAQAADDAAQLRFGAQRSTFQQKTPLRPNPAPTGQYIRVVVPGLGPAAGKRAGKVLIWLPAEYLTGPHDRTFPVIQAYAGVPGGPDDYDKRMQLQKMIVTATQTSGLLSPIVVIPDYTPSKLDTECTDSAAIGMESWLNKTVPDWVVAHLRVRPDRQSWAVMGYSAGGYCAAMSVFLHPQRFGAAMLFGSYNSPILSNWHPWGSYPKWPARYNLLDTVRHRPPPVDVWIEVSTGDRFSEPASAALIRAVRTPTSLTAVYLRGAGHRFDVWASAMPRSLAWLARTLPGFGAHTGVAVSSPTLHGPHRFKQVVAGIAKRSPTG